MSWLSLVGRREERNINKKLFEGNEESPKAGAGNLPRRKDDCMPHSLPFYIRDLSICGFGYLGAVLETKSLMDTKGWLQLSFGGVRSFT